MRFRSLLHSIGLMFALLTLNQCSYFFGEKEQVKVARLDREQGGLKGCLNQSDEVAQNYLKHMELSEDLDAQVTDLTGCYDEMLALFVKHTKSGSSKPSEINASQILGMFDKVYDGDHPFGADAIDKMLRLKAFFIGGSDRAVSYVELVRVRKLMLAFGKSLVKLRPYRSYFLEPEAVDGQDPKEFQSAFVLIEKEFNRFLAQLNYEKQHERIIDLRASAQFLSDFFRGRSMNAAEIADLDVLFAYNSFCSITMTKTCLFLNCNL